MSGLSKLFATFFYVGYFPVAPGSAASLLGGAFYLFLYFNVVAYLFVFIAITALGFLVCGRVENSVGKKDPSCIVIDEVAGAMIAFFMLPLNLSVFITAFFLFRAFDMFKVYPINRLEKLPGSAGVMMDDIVSGLYTNLIMQFALKVTGG